jgi:hypothetical protein
MSTQNLQPGDRVVELAALVHTTALLTGAASAACNTWRIKHAWLPALGALVAGAVLGLIVAQALSRLFFRTADW